MAHPFIAEIQESSCEGILAPFIEEMSVDESALFYRLTDKVFTRPGYFGFESDDEAAEAFLRYKSRLRSIIRKSAEISGNRDAYIDASVRFIAKSVKRNRRKKEFIDAILESTESVGEGQCLCTYTGSSAFSHSFLPVQGMEREYAGVAPGIFLSGMGAEKKRLLYLVLKCSWELDDRIAANVAEKLDVPLPWLWGLIQQGRLSLEPSIRRIIHLAERRNACWLKLRVAESQLEKDFLGEEARAALLKRISVYRSHYEKLRGKAAVSRPLVSNRMVALILNIPKGSVDSGIYHLKNRAAESRSEVMHA